MDKPKEKYWDITKMDVGTSWGNPNYIKWADETIKELLEICKRTLIVLTGPNSTSEGTWDDLEQAIKKAEGGK